MVIPAHDMGSNLQSEIDTVCTTKKLFGKCHLGYSANKVDVKILKFGLYSMLTTLHQFFFFFFSILICTCSFIREIFLTQRSSLPKMHIENHAILFSPEVAYRSWIDRGARAEAIHAPGEHLLGDT